MLFLLARSSTDESQKLKRGAIVSLDTFTWQMLASVFWPGSFIRCVVNATSTALALGHIDGDIAKAIPTVAGLAAIPFIVKPIDGTIDTAMEMSVSKALNGKIEGPADAGIALGVIARASPCPHLFTVAAAIGTSPRKGLLYNGTGGCASASALRARASTRGWENAGGKHGFCVIF